MSSVFYLGTGASLRRTVSTLGLLVGGLGAAGIVAAQGQIEEVVVTGSYIASDPQNQAVPVDVFDQEEFRAQGAPQIIDIIQNNPAMSGTFNRQEQYTGAGVATGTKSVNIRGLGADRSLVLMNGKRIINSAARPSNNQIYTPDIGNLPLIAMERIELLKNGGAVTYGTDAVAGVYNFITRKYFTGLELRGSHSEIDGSAGDQNLAGIWGAASSDDRMHLTIATEWERRRQLPTLNLGLATHSSPLDGGWPQGFSSLGNPGTFFPTTEAGVGPLLAVAGQRVLDPLCNTEISPGVFAGEISSLGTTVCGYSFVPFARIIEPQERIKIFSSFSAQINDQSEFYGEVLWARLNADYYHAPSYPPTSPAANLSTFFPLNNPGMQDFLNTISAAEAQPFLDAGGAMWWGRSLAAEGPSAVGPREHETYRFVAGVKGVLPFMQTVSYDASVTFSSTRFDIRTDDVLTDRFDLAANGLGGASCERASNDPRDPANDSVRGDAALGCSWFIPTGSAIGASPGSALYNDQALRDWFTGVSSSVTNNNLLVSDLVLFGDLPMELEGGAIGWALGYQNRYTSGEFQPTGDNRADGPKDSPFHFLGISLPSKIQTRNWAIFGEAQFPILNNLDVTLGVRHEDYGLDDVTKPKISGIWDVTEWLTLRASYEESFRVPNVPSSELMTLEFYAPLGEYIPIIQPVPTSLSPEEATNIGFGAILRPLEGLTVNIDYYSIDLEGPFGREVPTSASATPILSAAGRVIGIEAELINGDDIKTSGIDFEARYAFSNSLGNWVVGASGNYVLEYKIVGAEGSVIAGQSYDAAGKFNVRSTVTPTEVRPIPQMKLQSFAGLSRGNHSGRLYARYIDSYDVEFFQLAASFPNLTKVDSHLTFDAFYNYVWGESGVTVSASIVNIMDEDPPRAPSEMAYDAYTHDPIGRVFKIGFTYQLGGVR